MLVFPGDTITYANGMVGTVTKTGRLALVGRNGHSLAPKRQPMAKDYDHEIVTLSRSTKNDGPFEFFFDNRKGDQPPTVFQIVLGETREDYAEQQLAA